ncbi:MAG: ATP-binding cassette domain-containing protein [Fidelibacterota bacterium]|nr:MAG: ATP-binding cassette domain-containing protein [Candidatus Neomarinimicrobiota bacterium]
MPPSDSQGLDISRLVKNFNGLVAVDDVSFKVAPGASFGLLGPNGAGKTTIIRIVMGILGADNGEVQYQGQPITRLESRRFGYLPEERGLYQKTRLRETLVYLARLKGLTFSEAAGRVDAYLERFELQDYAQKNIQTLSKGNQQKAQFIAAIVHEPEVVILDEPFVGLDPVNQIVLKEIITELQAGGATILLSSHQMEQVERLCQAICLIDRGRVVLEGSLVDVKGAHSEQRVEVTFDRSIPEGVDRWLAAPETRDSTVAGELKRGLAPTLKGLMDLGRVLEFKVRESTLEEIFIKAVKGGLE